MALMSPDLYKSCFKSVDVHTTETSKFCASCLAAITFGEDDFLLGSKFHNRPLYVIGEVGGTIFNRILLDCGSAVNLIPLKTLHAIGMSARQLSPSMLTIQSTWAKGHGLYRIANGNRRLIFRRPIPCDRG